MMRIFYSVLLLLFFSLPAAAQNFAQRCEGKWEGTMYLYSKGTLTDSVDLIFTVTPFGGEAGHWIWKTEYVSEKMPLTKNYTLIQKSENEFLLDEGDGVILTNYVFGNKMYSLFETEQTWLTASYEFAAELLVFEVTSGVVSDQKSAGVTSYTVDFVQRVVLTKQK